MVKPDGASLQPGLERYSRYGNHGELYILFFGTKHNKPNGKKEMALEEDDFEMTQSKPRSKTCEMTRALHTADLTI